MDRAPDFDIINSIGPLTSAFLEAAFGCVPWYGNARDWARLSTGLQMVLRVTCKCGAQLKLMPKHADKVIQCPTCAKKFRVPASKFAVAAKLQSRSSTSSRSEIKSAAPLAEPASAAPTPSAVEADPTPASLDDELMLGMSGDVAQQDGGPFRESELTLVGPPTSRSNQNRILPAAAARAEAPTCPACSKKLAPGAKICVECGIHVKTGRSLLTSDEGKLDTVYVVAEKSIWLISWLSWIGLYPLASDAYGTKRPWAVRSIAIFTILVSVWFLSYEWAGSPTMRSLKTLMLWSGKEKPDADVVMAMYTFTSEGNSEVFFERLESIAQAERDAANDEAERKAAEAAKLAKLKQAAKTGKKKLPKPQSRDADGDFQEGEPSGSSSTESGASTTTNAAPVAAGGEESGDEEGEYTDEQILAAYYSLSASDRAFGEFHVYQLLTYALLHADLEHLLGNLLFLMIFGSRVNALIGNVATAILYPLLAILSAIGHMVTDSAEMPTPLLGASGAIMGLAGMYLVLFPIHKVHMAVWVRPIFLWPIFIWFVPTVIFRLFLKIFIIRGFWVVLFYIAFDVFATIRGSEDGVAHWAHLSGFGIGAVVALVLLLTRQINARGGDIMSAILGRHAWALVGRPRT